MTSGFQCMQMGPALNWLLPNPLVGGNNHVIAQCTTWRKLAAAYASRANMISVQHKLIVSYTEPRQVPVLNYF